MVCKKTIAASLLSIFIAAVVSAFILDVTLLVPYGVTGWEQWYRGVPKVLREIFVLPNISDKSGNTAFFLHGFQAVYLFGSLYFLLLGAGLLHKLSRTGMLEFYLMRPITRIECFVQIWLSGAIGIVLYTILIGGTTAGLLSLTDPSWVGMWQIWLKVLICCGYSWLTWFSIGIFFSGICKEKVYAVVWSFMVFVVVFCSGIAAMYWEEWMGTLGIYHMGIPGNVMVNGVKLSWVLVQLVLIAFSVVGGIIRMQKRDIPQGDER